MTEDVMDAVVNGTFVDPETGRPLSVPTESVAIRPSLAGCEQELVRHLGFGGRIAVVSDVDTREVLGRRVEKALAPVMSVDAVVLPRKPHADMDTVNGVRERSRSADALIAVGSGTINDLCKFAAHEDGKPYAVFGTAPSMNGYTSVNASITVGGMKKTLAAAGAKGVFLDLKVLAAAPVRMIRSGLGDSVCRSTAQADWLLAHLLLDHPYRGVPFLLLAADEPELLAESGALIAGDAGAMKRLARTLVLSGFGMTVCGGSQPASQGEHMISHYAEMMGAGDWPEVFHGEQIAVTTLTMAGLQERMLAEGEPPVVRPTAVDEAALVDHFGRDLGAACWREFLPKRLDESAAERMNARIKADWTSIRERILSAVQPVSTLRDALARAGAPLTAGDLDWPDDFYRGAVRHARVIRNRYTFLDLAEDSGGLDRFSPV